MSKTTDPSSRSSGVTRRQVLAGAGAGTAAMLLEPGRSQAAAPQGGTVVFTNTTVANPDAVQDDVALAVQDGRIAAIGPTDTVLADYPAPSGTTAATGPSSRGSSTPTRTCGR